MGILHLRQRKSIESILNPLRAKELTGNFLILVSARSSLTDEDEESTTEPQNRVDTAFKLIVADAMVQHYILYAEDPDYYHPFDEWNGPPFIESSRSWNTDWWEKLLQEDDKGMVGLDVYKMLKGIYGKGHWRSKAFENEVARTREQRLRGYDGGTNFRIP